MAMNYDDDREVTFEIVEEIGIIASSPTGWTKELNVVAWNGGQGKYDIREWSPHHDRMSKGITLNEQEMRMVVDLLKRRGRFNRTVPRGVTSVQGSRDREYPSEQEAVEPSSELNAAPEPADDEAWDAALQEHSDGERCDDDAEVLVS